MSSLHPPQTPQRRNEKGKVAIRAKECLRVSQTTDSHAVTCVQKGVRYIYRDKEIRFLKKWVLPERKAREKEREERRRGGSMMRSALREK